MNNQDFGVSFFGSMNGFLTTIAFREPTGVTISISVPSFVNGIGNQAYPMFFWRRGDIASAVKVPTSLPSFRTGHGCGSQGRTTSSPRTSTPTSFFFGPSRPRDDHRDAIDRRFEKVVVFQIRDRWAHERAEHVFRFRSLDLHGRDVGFSDPDVEVRVVGDAFRPEEHIAIRG